MSVSPCFGCTRVKNPQQCENKECRLWRRWFIDKWEDLRRAPRLRMERLERVGEGVVIGGQQYALPHRVQDYFGKDPCEGCLCPRDLCKPPCRVKRDWVRLKEETLL